MAKLVSSKPKPLSSLHTLPTKPPSCHLHLCTVVASILSNQPLLLNQNQQLSIAIISTKKLASGFTIVTVYVNYMNLIEIPKVLHKIVRYLKSEFEMKV